MPKENFMDYRDIKDKVDPYFEAAAKLRTNLGDNSTKAEKRKAINEEKRLYKEAIEKHPETKGFLQNILNLLD